MRRKEPSAVTTPDERATPLQAVAKDDEIAVTAKEAERKVFLLEDGKLQPFSVSEFSRTLLYEMVESFAVECRLVRPEDPDNLVYEGKKPSRKTVPVIVDKSGEHRLMASWEELEANPESLVEAVEVIGAIPVKQVFVLKRK
ncbi:MAG: hypothetical protein AB9873_04210 [Syntrophobacteraceae bacterium]